MRNNPNCGMNKESAAEVGKYVIRIKKKRVLDSRANDIKTMFMKIYESETVELDKLDAFIKKVEENVKTSQSFHEYFNQFARDLRINNITSIRYDEVYAIFEKWIIETEAIALEQIPNSFK
eukprot:TRINITY_DN2782_c0_g1_i2.p1 TRINITY_DN2782_c0_g1~~TRINITY_DN2782_c0_g1_i2.p1  ORF type:complete len:121 (-),score=25.35 TRINITY_DN2782_c0_g1_i2:85-447(-)